jgi:hypothetical protein
MILKSIAPDFTSITEAQGFFSETLESTTSSSFVTASFLPQTTQKTGGSYLIIHSCGIGNESNNRDSYHRVEWRVNNTGNWAALTEVGNQFSLAGSYELRTGVNVITINDNDFINFRFLFRRGSGGTATIRNKSIVIWKFTDA